MKIGIVQVALSHGGAERVGVMLANGFHQHGHQVSILTDLNERIDYQVEDSVQIIDFVGKKTNAFLKWMKAIKYIRKYVKKEKPDVLIGIMGLCTLATYLASIGLHVPIVMTEHNSFERPESAPMSFSQRVFKFGINRLYEHITVLTEADRQYIGNRLKNVIVMPNPLALKPDNAIPNKEKVILASGRLDAWHTKGFDILIKSFGIIMNNEELRIKDSGWHLQIAGKGSDESLTFLRQLCKENGVENTVDFLGFRTDIQELFKTASIFVLSSRYEGFGLVLIEAMSQGCACVACDYKGRQQEIMSPTPSLPRREGVFDVCENGILCEPDNVEVLANAMTKMIEDDSYRESVRQNAVDRSRYYSIENTIDRWELYLKAFVG